MKTKIASSLMNDRTASVNLWENYTRVLPHAPQYSKILAWKKSVFTTASDRSNWLQNFIRETGCVCRLGLGALASNSILFVCFFLHSCLSHSNFLETGMRTPVFNWIFESCSPLRVCALVTYDSEHDRTFSFRVCARVCREERMYVFDRLWYANLVWVGFLVVRWECICMRAWYSKWRLIESTTAKRYPPVYSKCAFHHVSSIRLENLNCDWAIDFEMNNRQIDVEEGNKYQSFCVYLSPITWCQLTDYKRKKQIFRRPVNC